MSPLRAAMFCLWLAALPAPAQTNTNTNTSTASVSNSAIDAALPLTAGPVAESVRSNCITGRRRICGRVLQVTKAGLVVDSGYPSLLEAPFNHSWVTRASAQPARPANLIEASSADSVAVGVLFLTDFPRRTPVHQYDYVALIGYPAGNYEYTPAPGVTKTVRRFAGGLERAVTLIMQARGH